MATTIYRSAAGRAAVLAMVERGIAELPLAVASRFVDTRFGATHVLVAGPAEAPPLLVIHGANGSADQMAAGMPWVARRRRCYFLDVPGEPNRSSEVRPGKRGDGLARWVGDVMGALGLERAALLGMSGGAYAVLKAAGGLPGRVTRAVLLVPEGLSEARPLAFAWSVLAPLLRYRLRPGEANARRVMATLCGVAAEEVPARAVERFRGCLDHVRAIADRGPMFTAEDLAGFTAPVLLVAAGRDVVFPGEPAVARARALLRGLADVVFLPAAGHVHPEVVGEEVARRVGAFLAEA